MFYVVCELMNRRGTTGSYPVSGSHTSVAVEWGGDKGGVWGPQNSWVEVPQNPGLGSHKTKPFISHIPSLPDFSRTASIDRT